MSNYQCQDCFNAINKAEEYCKSCLLKQYHNQYGKKPTDTHKERLAKVKQWTEEEIRLWNIKYKNWYWFAGVPTGPNYKVTWIEQYRIVDPEYNGKVKLGRPKKEKMYEYQDKGNLVCTICTNGKTQSEPMQDDDMYIAMCSGCKDWGEFKYKNELEK